MELNYNSAPALRAFLEENGLGMRKKYGQNFLLNPAIRRSLVDALKAQAGSAVWEIGPGLGAMTALLLEQGLFVRAFEIDPGFAGILRRLFSGRENFTLVEGDAMKTWPSQEAAPYLLGNLPYNIAAVLVAGFIEEGRIFERMVITVQNEVARRMAAKPGSADYSSLSVLCATFYEVKPLMLIRGASFYPRPNVDSRGLVLEKKGHIDPPPAIFYPLLRFLFSSRRKMIKNRLRSFIASREGSFCSGEGPEELCASVLEKNGIPGTGRAENLGYGEFCALAKSLDDMRT
jgi:16S rRNA (adenine1518-N6/adenine1519-N6)-dimethyltransferase